MSRREGGIGSDERDARGPVRSPSVFILPWRRVGVQFALLSSAACSSGCSAGLPPSRSTCPRAGLRARWRGRGHLSRAGHADFGEQDVGRAIPGLGGPRLAPVPKVGVRQRGHGAAHGARRRRSRGSAVVQGLLGAGFAGRPVSDRWSAYAWIADARRQLCWANLARAFQGLVDRGGKARPLGAAALVLVDDVFARWHAARHDPARRATLADDLRPTQAALRAAGRRAGQPGRQGQRPVLRPPAPLASTLDLRDRPRRGADQQRRRAGAAPSRAVAQGLLRHPERGRQPLRRAHPLRRRHLQAAPPIAIGVSDRGLHRRSVRSPHPVAATHSSLRG